MGRRVLVVGLGRTGAAVARVLAARGDRVTVVERRAAGAVDPPDLAGVAVVCGSDGCELLDGVDLVVPSPGVPATAPVLAAASRRGIRIESEIEVAAADLRCPIVAITGTNGKSTTTTFVGLALAASGRRTFTGGNLGTPLIAAVAAEAPWDVCVAEVSSFQLDWVERFRPAVGALLNLTDDHLDRHPTFAAYRDAKARLFARQASSDHAVLNRDDPAVASLAPTLRARVLTFGTTPAAEGAFPDRGAVVLRLPGHDEERYELAGLRLAGRHNLENVLAGTLVARLAGAPPAAVARAIETIEPLPHRLALVAERDGVRWYDDSKATNVGAAVKSLESFAGPVVLLAGGLGKGGSYAPLVAAARGRVRRALVFGAAREEIATALEGGGVPVARAATLGDAVHAAAADARSGDVVLLAPACASFDQFADYAARGRAFRAAVESTLRSGEEGRP